MHLTKTHYILIGIILLIFILAATAFPYVYQNRNEILQNPYVQRIIPIYHSMRKIPDIFFIPQTIFSESKLETYELSISENQLLKLNNALGDEPFGSSLKSENKVWVAASFRAPGYVDNVKVKYRGQLANHWNSYKKSYTIKFPKDNLFRGMRELSLIIPVDRRYFSTSLNNYRARKMDLLVPSEYYARLSVNGSQPGVMLTMEHWEQAWIEKQPISTLSGLYGIDETPPIGSIYDMQNIEYWKSWNKEEDTFPELIALIALTQNTSDKTFEKLAPTLLDLEAFYAADTIRLLTGGYHASDDGNNVVLLFDAAEGRFKPIPFNAGLSVEKRVMALNAPLLQKRIWDIPAFRTARDTYFTTYVTQNAVDDLAFVDAWIADYKSELYRDNAKLENNFMLSSNLKNFREVVYNHMSLTPNLLYAKGDEYRNEDERVSPAFPEAFNYVPQTGISAQEFAAQHPQFHLVDNDLELHGFISLSEDVIIPRNTKLTVAPNTTIAMGPDVSIISYSPIVFNGTEASPVTVRAQNANKPWGSIAVVNTNEQSNITHSSFENGSEERINGIWFSGMLAFHNAPVSITNSTVTNVTGEDGINVKGAHVTLEHTAIANTLSDGIDLDYVHPDSVISENTFTNIGGDAIDISWTNAPITNNTVSTCVDKGISVGERSSTTLSSNTIAGCNMGIAIKDQSQAIVNNNAISDNRIGIAVYQKKEFFGGGTAVLSSNSLLDNIDEIFTDGKSMITILE
ncbi:right-handed parallel beta-helix repeat-containing protein [Candidatus Pacebacteria bacterium]|nr:right-handed parallel beta-helix repeat-containing protein [Candidatus Paceibacterota bacterium]